MDETLLEAHVERFNAAVRSGDYEPMLAAFAPDAEMAFKGAPAGPFTGRDAIAAAYAATPPTDEVRLLGSVRKEDGATVADYAWAAEGVRAGRMLLSARDGLITRLVVTFEPPLLSPVGSGCSGDDAAPELRGAAVVALEPDLPVARVAGKELRGHHVPDALTARGANHEEVAHVP